MFDFGPKSVTVLLKKSIGCPHNESIQYHKSDVVSGSRIFCAYITQTNHQVFHPLAGLVTSHLAFEGAWDGNGGYRIVWRIQDFVVGYGNILNANYFTQFEVADINLYR